MILFAPKNRLGHKSEGKINTSMLSRATAKLGEAIVPSVPSAPTPDGANSRSQVKMASRILQNAPRPSRVTEQGRSHQDGMEQVNSFHCF